MMWWSGSGWGVGNWMMMGLMMVFFWGAVIALTLWVIRRNRSAVGAGGPTSQGRADRELAERFARGEIDEAQFVRTRSVLHSTDRTHQDS